ncbi:MAG: NAD(P)-binding domain-containing protein, partial [Proteobacteria bacterium]|nr:NAD(P)-binding domain-containing protein [Pseudomonadota bacterium]
MIGSQLSFIGAGNMNRAIIEGLLAADIPAQQLAVSNRSPDKLNAFESLGLVVSYSNVHIVEQADVVVLGVKPSQILGVVKEIREALYRSRPLLISLAAG